MPASWVISVATEHIRPDANGVADLMFTVTNTGTEPAPATLAVVPDGGATADWFSVAAPERPPIMPGSSASFAVNVRVPPGTAAGAYGVAAQVTSPGSPPVSSTRVGIDLGAPVPVNGSSTTTTTTTATTPVTTAATTATTPVVASTTTTEATATTPTPTPASPSRRPGWIIPVIGGAVALVIAAIVVVMITGGDDEPKTVAMPDLINLSHEQTLDDLDELGLEEGEVKYSQDPANDGKVIAATVEGEPVEPGAAVDAGSSVDLVIAVDLAAPTDLNVLQDSASGADPNHLFLSWSAVEHAAGYVVRVEQQNCESSFVFPIVPDQSERAIDVMPDSQVEILEDAIVDADDFIISEDIADFRVLPGIDDLVIDPIFRACSFAPIDVGGSTEGDVTTLAIDFVPGANSTAGQFTVVAIDDFTVEGAPSAAKSFNVA